MDAEVSSLSPKAGRGQRPIERSEMASGEGQQPGLSPDLPLTVASELAPASPRKSGERRSIRNSGASS